MAARFTTLNVIIASCVLASTTHAQFGSFGGYSREPMPVSGARSTRADLRVAQFEPSFGAGPPAASAFAQPNAAGPVASGPTGFVEPGFQPNSAPSFAPNATIGTPSFQTAPGYAPNYGLPSGPGGFQPSPYGAPNNYPNGYAPANGYGGANGFGPNGFGGNGFNAANAPPPYFRRSVDEASPFGRQPLAPYASTDFNAEPVDADLVVGLTPSRQSLNFGAGVGFNSDLGLFGQFIYDDRDFDWRAAPWLNPPVPFRGGGQRLRIEAMPGTEAQRYLVSFTEPYFARWAGQPIALNLSGFYFERDYFDWDERRFGGRVGLSYNLSRELVLRTTVRVENVDVSNPRLLVPELQRSLGEHELYGAGIKLAYDTRDNPYAPTVGGFFSAGFEQVFGTFDYPRGTVNFKYYETIRQRPDYSGRHVLGLHFDGGITGSQTPIYENFFAGGFSTLRGFRFRHASPKDMGVIVGGELSLLGSAEYFFPVTADDMVRGVFFTDFGTVEETTSIDGDNFRLSVGGGLRISVPALGAAPLAIDAAVPLMRADFDRVQNIAFFLSLGR